MVAAAALCAGCAGEARPDPGAPLELRIGTFANTGGRLEEVLSRETLVTVDWDGRPAFLLAESASVSPDGLALTVTLRPDIRFHTNEVVTAARVRDLLSAKADFMKDVSAIDADGERTIRIRLKSANALSLAALSEYTIHDENNPQIRTGPFRIVSRAPNAVLERFPEYHRGMPSVARVEIQQYPNHRAAWTAMMRGEVNFLHEVNRESIEFIQAGGNIRAYPMLRPYYYALVFNQAHPILQRRAVRIALTEAIDRDEIVRNGMRGHGRAADGPIWPYHWAHPGGRKTPAPNPEAARVRLDAAKLPVEPSGQGNMPARFAFTCLVLEGDTRFERIALVVQRQLFEIGVDMRIEPVPATEFGARLKAGGYDAFLIEMASGRTLAWPYAWWRSPGLADRVDIGYTGADDELDRMRAAGTDEAVRIAVADVMKELREDPPALFLVWPYETRAADASIAVEYEPERDIFGTLWRAQRAALSAGARR
jgi:peptide/nickel transport system substrate-binding protein